MKVCARESRARTPRAEVILYMLILDAAGSHRPLLTAIERWPDVDTQRLFGWHPLQVHRLLGNHEHVIQTCAELLKIE
jgi:hypothetical protein